MAVFISSDLPKISHSALNVECVINTRRGSMLSLAVLSTLVHTEYRFEKDFLKLEFLRCVMLTGNNIGHKTSLKKILARNDSCVNVVTAQDVNPSRLSS